MEEPFILEVEYNGIMCPFIAQLQLLGYIHRFVVSLPDMDIWFERDEEGTYRAIMPPETPQKAVDTLDATRVYLLIEKIEEILA